MYNLLFLDTFTDYTDNTCLLFLKIEKQEYGEGKKSPIIIESIEEPIILFWFVI